MDLATIVGLIVAWGAVFGCLFLEGGSLGEVFNLPALILVVFGTIGATVIGTSVRTLASLPYVLRSTVVGAEIDQSKIVDQFIEFARLRRRNGVLALEEATQSISDPFLRKGMELVVDGTPSLVMREILENEVVVMQERHKVGETVFTTLGGFSPTLGIIGTVMGLISMLAKLNEPGKMGHAIAAAFVATLYGVAFANLAYLPIAAKLKAKTGEEVVACEMIIEGVLSVQSGDHPMMLETRLMAFLPPKVRAERLERARSSQREDKAA